MPKVESLGEAPNLDGRSEVFARGHTGHMYHIWQTAPSGAWRAGWADFGFVAPLTIAASQFADGRTLVAGVTPVGEIGYIAQAKPNNGWAAWKIIGGGKVAFSRVVLARGSGGSLAVFGLGTDGAAYVASEIAGGGFSPWASLWGAGLRQLAAATNADGRISLFAIGNDSGAYVTSQVAPGSPQWSPWAPIYGHLDEIETGQNADGRLVLFGIGKNRAAYITTQLASGGAQWSPWAPLWGVGLRQLATRRMADGRLALFALGDDRAAYVTTQVHPGGSDWASWVSLYGIGLQQIVAGANADGRLLLLAIGGDGNGYWTNQMLGSEDWGRWMPFGPLPEPPPPPAPPHASLTAGPNSGYVNLGESVTLAWNVTNCTASCVVSLECAAGPMTYMHASGLLPQGSRSFAPETWTKCTIDVAAANGHVSADVVVGAYRPPSAPEGGIFYFKLTSADSFARPCFTAAIYAKDAGQGKTMIEQQNGGYTATQITAADMTTACGG